MCYKSKLPHDRHLTLVNARNRNPFFGIDLEFNGNIQVTSTTASLEEGIKDQKLGGSRSDGFDVNLTMLNCLEFFSSFRCYDIIFTFVCIRKIVRDRYETDFHIQSDGFR